MESRDNITKKDNIEFELKEKNLELDITLKKLESMEVQLIKQDKMASIGYLAAGVAHEINNPLGFIHSNFESLRKYIKVLVNTLNEYYKLHDMENYNLDDFKGLLKAIKNLKEDNNIDFIVEDIDVLMQECDDGLYRVKDIVKGLRNFSYEAAQDKFEEYDLNKGINNTLTIAKNEIKYYANVELELNDIPLIQAISGQINQVILNIVVNAVHAIKEKEEKKLGKIKITTEFDDKYVYCHIEDTGTGIAQENMNKIFKSFFTTKPQGTGTGLGLSISYNLIKNQHEGDICVESILGKGTKFTIKLPIAQNLHEKEF